MEHKETKQETSRRSSLKDKEDTARWTPPLEQTNDSSSILEDLKAYLDKRDQDHMSYLSQELAIREDLMEEKLKSLIDQKPTTPKTKYQEPDADPAPASDEQEFKSIRTC
jgi:hypothetical protein